MPVDARSCKHLRAVLGDAYEDARLKMRNPDGFDASAVPKKKAAPKKKRKTGDDGEDEEDEDDDGKVKVELLLASKWDLETGPDVTGWWMSEKLDGVR
jgi:DNA ligase-1